MAPTQADPQLWTMQFTKDGETFPFVEDENANITGLGHQDKIAFAEAINRFDDECTPGQFSEDERWKADDIAHQWAVLDADGERLHQASEGTDGAVAITTLWGAR